MPKGGPSGGDGGDGGDVVLEANPQVGTLLDLRYRRRYAAERGQHGMGKEMDGRRGAVLVVKVPQGTLVRDEPGAEPLVDLAEAGQRWVAARGGRGGRGNRRFATSINRAPRQSEPGTPGEQRTLHLELRLLADAGIVGYPNVGKSSFIARVSGARPKIADYPFTTLIPNLGVVELPGERHFVLADVPGLIEGAHRGTGLGDRFLRHLTRTRVLLHLVELADDPARDPLGDYDRVRAEIRLFDANLAGRPEIVALNKIDRPEVRARVDDLRADFARRGLVVMPISAATGEGTRDVLEALWRALRAVPA
jgi:GTP-binding protein